MENKNLNNEELNSNEEVKEVYETVDTNDVEQTSNEEILKIEEVHEDSSKVKFLKKILVSAMDQIIAIALSLVIIVLFDLIIKLFGFYVAQRQPIFLIIYVIVNILYSPICTSTKLNGTIGKKVILK